MNKEKYRRDIYCACSDICDTFSNNVLFKYETRIITFGETGREVRKRAAYLQGKGYGRGDVIGILSVNSPDWCITFLAISAIGCVVLPLDTNLSSENYHAMLRAVEAKAVFVSDEFKTVLDEIPVFDINLAYNTADESALNLMKIECDTTGALLFTSGTTGTPKIVTLTHSNLLHIAYVCTELEEYTENDVTLAMLPLFHVYALEATFLAPFVTGSSIVMQNSLKGPDIMKTLGENPVTIFPAAPLMWELFFDGLINKIRSESSRKYRLFMFLVNKAPVIKILGLNFILNKIFKPVHDAFGQSHRFFISGGAPLKREYFNYYKNMGFNIMEGYGLSETTGPVAIPYYKESIAGSVGAPIDGNEVVIRNINDDGIGEIWLRGDAIMPGYYHNEAANSSSFDADGFFNTGDLGRVDAKGNIFVTGRMKNVIVLESGKKVYPEELEFYFRQSPVISEIAIFDRMIDGRICVFAVVVPRDKNGDIYNDMRQTISELNRGLPEYRRVRRFAISLDDLPKNSSRKILYGEIKSLLAQGVYQENENDTVVLRDILTGDSVKGELIVNCLKEKLKSEILFRNQGLSDFNIDSMRLIELVVYLEQKLGLYIDVDVLRSATNLGEMVTYLSSLEEKQGQSLDDIILRGMVTTRTNLFFNPFHHVVLFIFKSISCILWRVKLINPEKMRFDNNILVANHQSYLDMVWLAFSIPWKDRRRVYVTAKKKLSFLRFIFPVLPIIYLDDNNSIEVLKAGADILRKGRSLIIFPEGTRTDDGNIHEFRKGSAYLAKNLNKKVIPVTVNGAYYIWPRGKTFPAVLTRRKGTLVVGDMIDPEKYDSVESLNAALEEAVKRGLASKA